MKKITWVNFLHIYQPPWQQAGVVRQAAIESYDYLFSLLEKYPRFRATINITGSLIKQLEEISPELLASLQSLVARNKVELTGSAMYHALLPLIPEEEVVRQIRLNEEILKKYFSQKITGFYLPEMAYSNNVAKVIKKLGYHWIILDQVNYQGEVDNKALYEIKDIGLKVIFRNRDISKSYPAEVIYKKLNKLAEEEIIITGTDGEMYGHYHEDWQGHIEKVLQNKQVEVLTCSQYLASLSKVKKISLRTAGWETTAKDLQQKIPFALWQHPKNKIHQLLWKLVSWSSKTVKKYPQDENFYWARRHLDRGLSSCTFWWASAVKPSEFSPLTWNPDMIDNGSEELIRSVRSLSSATKEEKLKAEGIYIELKKITWETHWQKYHRK